MLGWSLPRTVAWRVAVLLLAVWSAGCRPHDPPPAMPKDLGTPDRPLLPTPAPSYDQDILSGRATPIRAEDIAAEAPATEPTSEPEKSAASGEPAGTPAGDVTDEDRAMINDVVGRVIRAAAARNFDELTGYLVPEQREAALTLVQAGYSFYQGGSQLAGAIHEKAPGFADQLMAMFGGQVNLGAMPQAQAGAEPDVDQIVGMLKVGDLRMIAPQKATGLLGTPPQALPLGFDVIDGEWYVRLPAALVDAELVSGIQNLAAQAEPKMVDLANRLRDGSLLPEQLMPAFMMAIQELQPAFLPLGPKLQALQAEVTQKTPPAAGAEVPADIRQAIEELVAAMDTAEGERRWEDLVALYAPEQQQAARAMFGQAAALIEAIERLAAALDTAQAGAGNSFRQLVTSILTARQTVSGMQQIAEGRIAATITEQGQPQPVEFHLIDGEWYAWDPDLADAAKAQAILAAISAAVEGLEALAGQLADGSVAAAAAPARIVAILSQLAAQMRRIEGGTAGEALPTEGQPPSVQDEAPSRRQAPPSGASGFDTG